MSGIAASAKRDCQQHVGVAAGIGVVAAFDRGRGRAEDHPRPGESRPDHGHVAGVVVDPVRLLEGAVVLLIEDDQPQFAERQEQRRAGADHGAHRAARSRRARCGRAAPGSCRSAIRPGRVPKRVVKRSRKVWVSAISGSRISACRPARSVSATASKNTSVLPLPVTPSSSATPNRVGVERRGSGRAPPACSALSVGQRVHRGRAASTIGGGGDLEPLQRPGAFEPLDHRGRNAAGADDRGSWPRPRRRRRCRAPASRAGVIRSGSYPVAADRRSPAARAPAPRSSAAPSAAPCPGGASV